ncbi:hypothetical protein BMS3Bbin03_01944 [bacterium BMS3Bbin03]|nr:hypothetical protein BMS3Bbin03_01944 [bacterium BMS3Bbin03]
MVHNEWIAIPERFPNVKLHESVVMPNHFHAIMEITATSFGEPIATSAGATLVVAQNKSGPNKNTSGHPTESGQPQGFAPTRDKTVGDIAGAFESITIVKYIHGFTSAGPDDRNRTLVSDGDSVGVAYCAPYSGPAGLNGAGGGIVPAALSGGIVGGLIGLSIITESILKTFIMKFQMFPNMASPVIPVMRTRKFPVNMRNF